MKLLPHETTMPKRTKRKNGAGAGQQITPRIPDGEVYRNVFAVGDDVDPRESLQYMQEMFKGKIDPDVVAMIFSECAYDVDQALESLIALSNDHQSSDNSNLQSVQQNEYVHPCVPSDSSNSFTKESSDKITESSDFSRNIVPPNPVPHQPVLENHKITRGSRPVFGPDSSFVYSEPTSHKFEFPLLSPTYNSKGLKCQNSVEVPVNFMEMDQSSHHSLEQLPFDGPNPNSAMNSIYTDFPEYSMYQSSLEAAPPASPFYASVVRNNLQPFLNANHSAFPDFHSPLHFITPHVPVTRNKQPISRLGATQRLPEKQNSRGPQSDLDYIKKLDQIKNEIENGEKVLIILRGLPGSGKSTLAKELRCNGRIFSTDDYFCRSGRYLLDITKLSTAHEWNRRQTQKAMKRGITPVVVDNTNLEAWEMMPYVSLGYQLGYKMYLLEPNTPWRYKLNKLARKNQHNVSKEKIERMLERFDRTVTIESMLDILKRSRPKSFVEPVADHVDSNDGSNVDSGTRNIIKSDSDDSLLGGSLMNGEVPKLISLEAVVHREDESAPVVVISNEKGLSNDPNGNTDIADSGVAVDGVIEANQVNEGNQGDQEDQAGDQVDPRLNSEEKVITDLNELRYLLREESEDSHSQNVPSTDSSQDISGWEAITEHDDDFQWSSTVPPSPTSLESCSQELDQCASSSTNEKEVAKGDFAGSAKKQDEKLKISDPVDWLENKPQIPLFDRTENFDDLGWDKTNSSQSPCHENTEDYSPKPARNVKACSKLSETFKNFSIEPGDQEKFEFDIVDKTTTDYDWSLKDKSWSDEPISQSKVISPPSASPEPKPQRKLSTEFLFCKAKCPDKSDQNTEESSNKSDSKNPKKKDRSRIAASLGELSSLSERLSKFSDWSFPPYIQKDSSDIKAFVDEKREESGVLVCTTETQTEPGDFVTLHHVVNNPLYITSLKVLASSDQTQCSMSELSKLCADVEEEKEIVPKFLRLDKSTSTDDMALAPEMPENIEFLKSCFPEISDDDLKYLLEICHNDCSWASNILMEWGYKYNVPDRNVEVLSEQALVKDSNDKTVPSDCDQLLTEAQQESSSVIQETDETAIQTVPQQSHIDFPAEASCSANNDNVQAEQSVPSFKNQSFTLTLDPSFAMQLERLFGPVSQNVNRLCPENLFVNVDLNLAKHIYHRWRATLECSPFVLESYEYEDPDTRLERSITSASANIKIQEFVDTMNKSEEPLPLSKIMDMEEALQLHYKEEIRKSSRANENLASKLKRMELYRMFPGVDPLALDNVFDANNCSLKKTVIALEEDIGKPAKLPEKTAYATGDSGESKDAFKDFITENWSDWIYQDGFSDSENLKEISEDSSNSPEVESLRAQAAMHYQLRQECIRKAQEAYRKKMGDVASFYSQKGEFHLTKFREANKKASAVIFENKNKHLGPLVLDLHGLYVQEAIRALTKFLNQKKLELSSLNPGECQSVTVVTGRGTHSLRVPKLRPSVIRYLESNGYRFDEINLGVFNVHLSAHS